jgi:hypothetical protein
MKEEPIGEELKMFQRVVGVLGKIAVVTFALTLLVAPVVVFLTKN